MNDTVATILDSMTVDEYVVARGGLRTAAEYVAGIVERSGIEPAGRVLELGAGNCKSSAVLSRHADVTEVVAVDFSEPLLCEIGPRVISYLDGDLEKFVFHVGDMHELETVAAGRTIDLVICYYLIHHVLLPEHFFRRLREILSPRGHVLCLREPARPVVAVPGRYVRRWRESMARARRNGESENVYTAAQYRRMSELDFGFRLVNVSAYSDPGQPKRGWPTTPYLWYQPFDIAYLLAPN